MPLAHLLSYAYSVAMNTTNSYCISTLVRTIDNNSESYMMYY